MADFASELGLVFQRLDSKEAIPKDGPLQNIKKLIDGQIKKNDFSVDYWWDDRSELMKKLRYKYFHFSANYQNEGIANGPQFKNGKRKRVIQHG